MMTAKPQRSSRPGALKRIHSHTRSTGAGSKVGLNLQFTQKDAPRSKRSSVGQHSASRVQLTLGRTSSAVRVSSRDNLAALTPRARQTSANSKLGNGTGAGKHKAGFTLASRDGSGSDEDEDSDGEWISSESGATTPNKHTSAGPASRTPPAIPPTITTEPRTPSPPPLHIRTEPTTPTTPTTPTSADPPSRHARHRSTRHSHTRPPSIISDHGGALLRPHPLIRGNSHGLGAVAPLTISSAPVQAQLATPPPTTPVTSTESTPGPVQFRRTSSASARSVATLPARNSLTPTPTSTSGSSFAPSRGHDRTRTLSAVSASSAALSSLVSLPSRAYARHPQGGILNVRFPPVPQEGSSQAGGVHALLPAPYVQTHATVLAWRAPVRESFERVAWARARAGL